MSESERSEPYGTPMSSDDVAELEELRREAAVLREQLENAVGPQSGLRSARDVHQLEARIDSLAARNSKLMETLKEARQQLLALREEVDRLGQPPSGYGVLLGVHDDDTKRGGVGGVGLHGAMVRARSCARNGPSPMPALGGTSVPPTSFVADGA